MPSLRVAHYRLRLLFRGAFLALAIAVVAMAVYVLREEKALGLRNYQELLAKSEARIAARLREPSGQLALLNPPAPSLPVDAPQLPLHPLLLPFSALDFDDPDKVQQAIELTGCLVQYEAYASLCVATGADPRAGGFIYVAGSFASGELSAHLRGQRDLTRAHRLRVRVDVHGRDMAWVAPFERQVSAAGDTRQGRLTGFAQGVDGSTATRPEHEFRGWLWQSDECLDAPDADNASRCERRSFFSVRLPVAALKGGESGNDADVWPPPDLAHLYVHVQMLPPGDGTPLLDSDSPHATPPFSLTDLAALLQPGERLVIRREGESGTHDLFEVRGREPGAAPASRWIDRLIRHLDVPGADTPAEAHETIATPVGGYQLDVTGNARAATRSLTVVATRVSGFVGGMLLAILLAWLAIEAGIISRIAILTRRALSVSRTVRGTRRLTDLNLDDLRGSDELGVLAACLSDLLRRVQEDVEREHIRADQEKDLWHAVGHEIMSPLQSLMVLHSAEDDPSQRYVRRMQQAVRVLYGSASPSEAFQATTLQLAPLDLEVFLQNVALNAPHVGIEGVRFEGVGHPVPVRADEHSLEDVVTHVLRNAQRHRRPDSPIGMRLTLTATAASVAIHNVGEHIAGHMLAAIFEYGVSDAQDAAAQGNRGQGLFVAKTYMAKMGGTISAQNAADGVIFTLTLPRSSD